MFLFKSLLLLVECNQTYLYTILFIIVTYQDNYLDQISWYLLAMKIK